MATFESIDLDRIDVYGLAVIDPQRQQACRDWLIARGYKIDTLDCGSGRHIETERIPPVPSITWIIVPPDPPPPE